MAFNAAMFKAKKKRVVDPNAPPRPNLLSHEKKMKESAQSFAELVRIVQLQQEEITRLKSKTNYLDSTVNAIITTLRGKK